MPTVREVIKHLKSYKPDEHIATAIWCEEDVLGRAKERHIPITREQAQEILDKMDIKQDCELGITWTTIDCYLDDYSRAYDKHDQARKHPMYPAPLAERR
jgi:hypothetical protein